MQPNDHTTDRTLALPTEIWREVLSHLGVDAREVATVSRQLLQAWRAGVLSVRLQLGDQEQTDFFRLGQFADFPALRQLHLSDNRDADDAWSLHAPPAPAQRGLALGVHLSRALHVQDTLALARAQPGLAARVTQLTLGERPRQPMSPYLMERHPVALRLPELVAAFPHLREVAISGCPAFQDGQLAALAACADLQHLSLSGCPQVTVNGLRDLGQACPGITRLRLENCCERSLDPSEGLQGWPSLRELSLLSLARVAGRPVGLGDASLQRLADGLPRLETLQLLGCHRFGQRGIEALGAARPSLRRLRLGGTCANRINDTHLEGLRTWGGLQALDISGCHGVTDEGLCALFRCPSLTELCLDHCTSITGEDLMLDGTDALVFPALQSLSLVGCLEITGQGLLRLLENCPTLRQVGPVCLQGEAYEQAVQELVQTLTPLLRAVPIPGSDMVTHTLSLRLNDLDANTRVLVVRAVQAIDQGLQHLHADLDTPTPPGSNTSGDSGGNDSDTSDDSDDSIPG